jgi:hypothetical protein
MGLQCEMKMPDGSRCPELAVHHWGPVNFCCPHFDDLVMALYDLQGAVSENRHEALVQLYEQNSKHLSRMADLHCPEKKEGGEK